METKKCIKCGEVKSVEMFYAQKRHSSGLQTYCKKCISLYDNNYHKTKIGLLSVVYYSQVSHSKQNGYNPPKYSKNDFIIFGLSCPEFHKLYDNWVRSGYIKLMKPSFDRSDDYSGYSFENFNKWMTWGENKHKGENDIKNGVNNKISRAIIATNIKTGEELYFYSINQAEREIFVPSSHICHCCCGDRKTSGGYRWRYA